MQNYTRLAFGEVGTSHVLCCHLADRDDLRFHMPSFAYLQ